MCSQIVCTRRFIITLFTIVWLFSAVCFQMRPQSSCLNRSKLTLVALVCAFKEYTLFRGFKKRIWPSTTLLLTLDWTRYLQLFEALHACQIFKSIFRWSLTAKENAGRSTEAHTLTPAESWFPLPKWFGVPQTFVPSFLAFKKSGWEQDRS